MTRLLYRCLLRLHPAAFRRQFAGEMLWIYDEAAASCGPVALLSDGVVSLARQWFLRTSAWTMAAGGLSALVLMSGMLSLAALPARHVAMPEIDDPPVTAASGSLGPFDGHWAGNFLFPGPAGQMEFTLSQDHGAWIGELQVRGPDGLIHRGVAEDIRVGADALSFRFKTTRGDMAFRGRIIQGKLKGYMHPARTAAD